MLVVNISLSLSLSLVCSIKPLVQFDFGFCQRLLLSSFNQTMLFYHSKVQLNLSTRKFAANFVECAAFLIVTFDMHNEKKAIIMQFGLVQNGI